jgi:lysozyme family protein
MKFDDTINEIIRVEGGYTDHPSDKGGATKYGITEVVARANGYTGDMKELPQTLAFSIYLKRYVTEPGFDKVAIHSELVAKELIDTGVNMGPAKAAMFLQRCLNAFNMRGSRYPDMFVDGKLGPVSLAALVAYLKFRGADGERVLVTALNCVQGVRYLEIAEANPTQEDFTYGWFRNRVSNP